MAIPISSKKHQYTLWYCPKSACTYIRAFFLHLHQTEHPEIRLEWDSLHSISREFRPIENPKHSFIFVRNPYARAISMYVNKYCGNHPDGWGRDNLPPNLSFSRFIDEIHTRKDDCFYRRVLCHYEEQTKDPSVLKTAKILKCEDGVEGIIQHYRKYIGLRKTDIHDSLKFASTISHKTNYGRKRDHSSGNINFYPNRPITHTRKSFFTKGIKRKVYQLYRQDFELLGYPQ